MPDKKPTASQRTAATTGTGMKLPPAPARRAPADDVLSPALPMPAIRPRSQADLDAYGQAADSARLAEYAGPAFYDAAKLNAVRQARGGAVSPFAELQSKVVAPPPRMPSPPAMEPRTMQPLGMGLGFGPAAEGTLGQQLAANIARPAGGFTPARADGSRTYTPPPSGNEGTLGQSFAAKLRGPGEVGSAGVMTTQARARALAEAQAIPMPAALRSQVEKQIYAGDYTAPARAAELVAKGGIMPGREKTLGEAFAERLRAGGQGVADKKAQDQARYHETAMRNMATAQGNSAEAMKLGLNPLASRAEIQAARSRVLGAASAKDLQPLAAAGDAAAAAALQGQPGPWAGGLNRGGVLAREREAAESLANINKVLPAQINAQGQLTRAQLQAAGKTADQANKLLIEQTKQQTEVYKAQLRAQGYDERTAALLGGQFAAANGRIIASGMDPVTPQQFHSQMGIINGAGSQSVPMPPTAPGQVGAQLPGGQSPGMPHPMVAQQPPWVQQKLSQGMSQEEWAVFNGQAPDPSLGRPWTDADRQKFLADVAAGRH